VQYPQLCTRLPQVLMPAGFGAQPEAQRCVPSLAQAVLYVGVLQLLLQRLLLLLTLSRGVCAGVLGQKQHSQSKGHRDVSHPLTQAVLCTAAVVAAAADIIRWLCQCSEAALAVKGAQGCVTSPLAHA
jgi:hypothetical protein